MNSILINLGEQLAPPGLPALLERTRASILEELDASEAEPAGPAIQGAALQPTPPPGGPRGTVFDVQSSSNTLSRPVLAHR